MEIGPVTGIRIMPTIKEPSADLGLSGVFDIENFARAGDETYTPAGAKAAGGHEDEFDDPLEDDDPEPRLHGLNEMPKRKISFFA